MEIASAHFPSLVLSCSAGVLQKTVVAADTVLAIFRWNYSASCFWKPASLTWYETICYSTAIKNSSSQGCRLVSLPTSGSSTARETEGTSEGPLCYSAAPL